MGEKLVFTFWFLLTLTFDHWTSNL